MYGLKIRDAESYLERLRRFLSDRCLIFNPYEIADEWLMEVASSRKWRGAFSLTQMVVLSFVRVATESRGVDEVRRVHYRVGDSDEEVSERMEAFLRPQTAADSLQPEYNILDGRRIARPSQIRGLVGKQVFVSRNIITTTPFGYGKAMRMHRLTGDTASDAATVREAMTEARLEMLRRFLRYPQSPVYLDGSPDTPIDIQSPVRDLMTRIESFRPRQDYEK